MRRTPINIWAAEIARAWRELQEKEAEKRRIAEAIAALELAQSQGEK